MPYADPHSERARESSRLAGRRHYAKNREKIIAASATWQRDNKERVNRRAVVRRSTKLPVEKVLFNNAQQRAKRKGIPFTITVSDIVVPSVCPILGLPLVVGTGSSKPNSPSLDRIEPAKGYVPGNIQVLSHKANTIKSNATVDELRAVLSFMEKAYADPVRCT